MTALHGCGSQDGTEIDGQEFEAENLTQLMYYMKLYKQLHLTYFEDIDEDLDLWIKVD